MKIGESRDVDEVTEDRIRCFESCRLVRASDELPHYDCGLVGPSGEHPDRRLEDVHLMSGNKVLELRIRKFPSDRSVIQTVLGCGLPLPHA
jgi:hypothetical protein